VRTCPFLNCKNFGNPIPEEFPRCPFCGTSV